MTALAGHLKHMQNGIILLIVMVFALLSLNTPQIDTSAYGALYEFLHIILSTIADAYIQVTTFVAATLFIFYGLEKWANIDAEALLAKSGPRQIIYASMLGALPGCGGAIIVITQYTTGRLSFGAVTAVLTATMGDAAFLLIAQEPLTGLAIMAMGFGVGVISGYIVDAIHGQNFLRPAIKNITYHKTDGQRHQIWLNKLWLIILIPGIALGIAAALQIDVDAIFSSSFLPEPSITIGASGGILSVLMFTMPKFINKIGTIGGGDIKNEKQTKPTITERIMRDTNFVTAWVVFAFLLFEISVYAFNINLGNVFKGYVVFAPLIATILGFIPGCGPQVLVTALYLAGAVPLSAQISNAISNDGDALFPAIAIAPKAAVIATIYSAIPALVIGYGWFFLVES